MHNVIVEFYNKYYVYILVLYFGGAALLIGSTFCMSFVLKPVIFGIKIPNLKYTKAIKAIKKFLNFTFLFFIITMGNGVIISVGKDFNSGNPGINSIVHIVQAMWIFMGMNFLFVFYKLKEAFKSAQARENVEAHESLELILSYILPFNLCIGIALVYFNVLLGIGA